jgi:hypothetical protein
MDYRTLFELPGVTVIRKAAIRTARNAPRRNRAKHRREARNGRVGFVCLASALCDLQVDARTRGGRPAVALAEDVSAGPVSARATLYARPRTEMARETHGPLSTNPRRLPALNHGDRRTVVDASMGSTSEPRNVARQQAHQQSTSLQLLPRNAPARIVPRSAGRLTHT